MWLAFVPLVVVKSKIFQPIFIQILLHNSYNGVCNNTVALTEIIDSIA